MYKAYRLTGPIEGTHKEFVDKLVHDIKDRLFEAFGDCLPTELDGQLEYIVSETYNKTRNHCAMVWNVEPKEGW